MYLTHICSKCGKTWEADSVPTDYDIRHNCEEYARFDDSDLLDKTPTINFSHKFIKMPDGIENLQTMIAFVAKVKIEELPKWFKSFDTAYYNKKMDVEHYPLPKKGDFLLISLMSSEQMPDENYLFDIWQTLRRSTPQKDEYYKSLVGMKVNIRIKEK